MRHDGLLFASGWYVSADEYTQFVVDEAIARYHADGLETTLPYYDNAPAGVPRHKPRRERKPVIAGAFSQTPNLGPGRRRCRKCPWRSPGSP